MSPFSLRSLLLAAIVLSNCITWTASRHHYTHNVSGHRSRHRRQGAGLFLSASYVLPGGEGTGWGEWGEVSPCSRTCGGGVASQKRICLQIGPDGQPQCTGGDTKYFSCQTQDCPAGTRDFREEQCSEFDDVAFRDIKYRWVPYTQGPNPCELNCMPHGERFYYRHRTKVLDGTRCNDESFDVCVNGTCQPVGCDMMLGSTAREDKCRECRGNGANCQTTVGLLDTQDLRKGYNDMLLIPEGATSIFIAERAPSINYLALRAKNGTYYLNGEYHIDFPRSLMIAGALWYYERSQQGFAAPDKLRCLGPTNEPLYLALLLQDENVGIDYEYSVPNELAPPRNKRYNWVHEEFTPCSAPCGGGFQTRNVSCRSREELELVDEGLCEREIRPPTNQTCNTEPCAPQWSPGPWGQCSKRCGKGGTRSREVHCTQIITNGYPSIVADKSCFDLLGPKPELFQECNENATCPIWFTGPWKPCDKLCDEGKQTRQVVCYQKNGRRIEVLDDKECVDEKPAAEQTCMLQSCDGVDWVLSDWSGCDTCLSTVRSRSVFCVTKEHRVVNDSFCAYHSEEPPKTQEDCDPAKLPPCDVQWYATQWSKCSVECGKGVQTRKVFCGVFEGDSVTKVADAQCSGLPKYNDTKECEIPEENCPSQWFAGPWSACTKKCGGGEQFRRVMCLRSGEPATDCNGDVVLDSAQSCNPGPCDKDELLPVDDKSPPVEDDYDECAEEEEEYPEIGLDADTASTMDDFVSGMFSDSPAEGSETGSTAEHESTFPETKFTLTSEEFLTTESGNGFSDTDITDTSEESTDTTPTDLTGSTSGYETSTDLTDTDSTSNETESTITEGTDSTESTETDVTSSDETEETGSTVTDTTNTSDTSSTSYEAEESSESEATSESGSTEETDTSSTEETSESTPTSETENGTLSTETSGSTESSDGSTVSEDTSETARSEETSESEATSETWSTESEMTSETESTVESSTETTESSATESTESTSESGSTEETSESGFTETGSTETTETGTTEATETGPTEATETTITGSTESESTDITETGSTEPTETTETGSTQSTETTETGPTEATETTITGSTESESTDITETGSTEPTETTETGSTQSTETTEAGSTEPTETTETGSTEPTETTEAGSTTATETTETGSTDTTETTEAGSTTATETTETESTDTTETTETGSTESTETTETGSTDLTEITETGSTEVTETTETGSTEPTETTETGSTEPTETTHTGSTEPTETTETGSTEPTETTETGSTEATETTETGSTEQTETTETGSTELTETTESGSTESTVTEETTTEVSGSTETTEEGSTVTEFSTTEASTEGFTRWDLSSTVEVYTTKKARVCRPRPCLRSEFGCCPDKKTPALGPFEEGCPKPKTCKDSIYGCCPDGVSAAQGKRYKGCPVEPCAETLFGCCTSDNKTAAEGNDQEGCPPPPPACLTSKYRCCEDGETEATGPEKEGCPETTTTVTDTEGTEETSTTVAVTEEIKGCAGSEYGCCSDNETAASGPELQGCLCNTTTFGCCPDGVAPAQGPDFEGCVKSCNSSTYGCCPDGKTPAHGPDHEGCCLLYAYGCCPDNYKPADGPHLEGCGCQYSRFGCCPDNVTVATGPDNKGCGCQYTQHGCCPDRHSEASGPDFEGCMCHTYQFGCCPDGVTIARGPNGQGCYCQQSTFGCCGDEQTHAKGPEKEGCDCATSKYGCCPDGTTEAIGPKFEGCTDKPENRQAACSLKFERGPCRNYSVNWFYDTEYGGCSRFWYGGCDGNGNRFGSKEECEDTCVSPPPKDACKLPQIKGACLGYNVRWYYDNNRETCTNFIYGGCLGNNNNFETRELCQAQCEPERALDQCNLEIERGTCAGNFPRWGFNKEMRRCEQFIWGGCEGNSNRFSTEAACLLRCNPPGEPQPECSETQEAGNCTDTEALWSFSQSENRCVPFYYTGCGGNGNKFTTREECQEACPSAFVPELCTLPASTGDCADYREKWYFDTKDQRCRQFYYGGCGGNDNKFDTEQECSSRCSPPAVTTAPPSEPPTAAQPRPDQDRSDFCFLEIDAGPCNQLETKWGYDYTRGKCTAFQYGGCGGNQNNFPTEEHCTYYCKPVQDICQLPMLAGPCDDSLMRWFYDASSDSCSQFTYGGCEGNDNRFESREECENRCKIGPAPSPSTPTITTTTVRIDSSVDLPPECSISPELEECSSETVGEVWYYDQAASACSAHENLESGVRCRNRGTFYSQEACERSCGVFRNIDVCRYPLDPGPCHEYHPKYHYNESSHRCEEFAYGGCVGGPNRFSSAQECQQICMTTVDICSLPAEPGNCLDRLVMWYYDQNRDQCYQFAYGGCGGNDNKFETRELCEGHCKRQPAAEVTTATPVLVQTTRQPEPLNECRTPVSLEPCGTNITAFYYDERIGRCMVAEIGGCSYSNRYRSEEECERRCGAFKGLDVCHTQLDPGPCRASIPKFYFDAASGSCRSYAYGGCQGGPNRFSTSAECEEVCADAGPARACLAEVTTGERCAAAPQRRWHYDVDRADCLVFAYEGCGGTENNFASYEQCAYLCRVALPDTEDSRNCDHYAEECITLELSCENGVRREVAPEGCERCVCEAAVSCEEQRRTCDALRCPYGIERTTGDDGCEKCRCFEDPCSRNKCTYGERCVASAYRDPATQAVLYSAHCVPEIETNEVLPECEAYIAECARLSCPFGVQRVRTARGCERCACVRQEVDCAPLQTECERLKCHYGLARTQGDDGCERCSCLEHPCSGKVCPDGERCVAMPFRDPITQEPRYSADCRTVNKAGVCPADASSVARSTESACRLECTDDADCRGVLKCCVRACSQVCVAPAAPTAPPVSTTHGPEVPQAPQPSTETEPEVAVAEGGKATLRCIFHGNPPPLIVWRFGEIIITGDVDRYRILSDGALEIIAVHRNDSGVYICVAENELGTAQQEVTLRVNDPERAAAAIAGAAGAAVTGELGQAVTVRCRAYGYPPPTIFWYRGRGGALVPFYTGVYEARGQELQIKRLSLDALGEYECQAYNGEGRPATWRVTVQAYQPPGRPVPGNRYVVPRDDRVVEVTPRPPPAPGPAPGPEPGPERDPDLEIAPFTVPVQTKLLVSPSTFSAGAQVSLPCEVDGYPEPEVRWTKDGVALVPNDRMWITGARLTILRSEVNDSGEYTCHAANAYSSHESTARITVQEVYVPAKCLDNPMFANCALIVQSRFCSHKYYSRFCCKSCVEAGQLDPRDVEMQADEPFRKK